MAYLASKGLRGRAASGGREMTYACFFDCGEPADSKKKKLYVNVAEAFFSCKVCGSSGGAHTLQRHFGDDPRAGTNDDAFTRRRILDWAAQTGAEMLANRDDVLLHLLNDRGLSPDSILERKLGFVADGWSLTGSLPADFTREQLAQTGLVWKDGPRAGTDYFYRHLLIPVMARGHVIQIRGRIWGESKGAKYLSGPGEPARAFNIDSLDGADEVILTEGEIDCIRLHEVLRASSEGRLRKIAVVGLPGTSAYPDELDDYLSEVKRIYIGFDSDEPGRIAAEKLRDKFGARARVLQLPIVDGRKADWTEFLLPAQDRRAFEHEHPYAGHDATDVLQLMSGAAGKRIYSVAEAGAAYRSYRATHTALRTGWTQLDALIAPGLLPGQIVFILARTGAGKTVILCNLAYQMRQHGILFISLEMTREEIYHRLQRVYWHHHPTASIQELEYAFSKVWICDENRLGEKDLQALVNEYAMENGTTPDVVFVDYLGYYARGARGSSPYEKTTNAAMQLKADAKAGRLVIISPAQVNRVAKDGKPIDLDEARDSVTGDTRIVLTDGSYVSIADLVDTYPQLIVTDKRYQYTTRRAARVWAKGEREVFTVTTRTGRRFTATPEHPMLTDDREWQPVSVLKIGDRIAIPAHLPVFGYETEPHAELLGMLIADGGLTTTPISFVKGEAELVDHVELLSRQFGADPRRFIQHGRYPGVRFANGEASLTAWMRELGLFGVKSPLRFTPEHIFRCASADIAAYLRGLFNCDGHVTVNKGVYYTSTSERLIRDVQHLLTRFNINGVLERDVDVWRLCIRRRGDIATFATVIGMTGRRAVALEGLLRRPSEGLASKVLDTYSSSLHQELHAIRRGLELGWAVFSHSGNPYRTGLDKNKSFTRTRLRWLAEQVNAQRLLDLVDSPLGFDEITSIESDGRQMVYDASVIGLHNFVGDFVFSNSGAVGETGDFVFAAYRPDDALVEGIVNVPPTYRVKLSVLKSRHGGVGKVISLQMDALTLAIVEEGTRAAKIAEEHNVLMRRGKTWDQLRAEQTQPRQLTMPGTAS